MVSIFPFKRTDGSIVAAVTCSGTVIKALHPRLGCFSSFEKVKWLLRTGSWESLPKWEPDISGRGWRQEEPSWASPLTNTILIVLFFSLSVRMCVCVNVCLCKCVCVCTFSHVSSSRTLSTSFEAWSPIGLKLSNRPGWLASKPQPPNYPCLPTAEIMSGYLAWHFHVCSGIPNRFLLL